MAFAELYHALAAPLATIEFTEEDGVASWVIESNARAAADPQIYGFVAGMQIGIHISLMRDIMGSALTPDPDSLPPKADDFSLAAEDQIGCGLSFASGKPTGSSLLSAWLDPGCESRQRNNVPDGRDPLRRPAQRSEINTG